MANIINTDIYRITDTTQKLESRFADSDDTSDTLQISTFGYLSEQFSRVLQNSIIMGTQTCYETLITKAKDIKTLLTQAVEVQLDGIMATPAYMNVLIGFDEKELLSKMKNNRFTLSRDSLIQIGDYVFHLPYDLMISTEQMGNGEYIYTARYGLNSFMPNFCNIDSAYLSAPYRQLYSGANFIYVPCRIIQIEVRTYDVPILSNNILENKTADFQFNESEEDNQYNQLAGFEVKIISSTDGEVNLNPVFEGMPPTSGELYCFYNFLSENTIRLKFDSDSYMPSSGDTVAIRVYTTSGESGNFKYAEEQTISIENDNGEKVENGINFCIVLSQSGNGKDKLSKEEMKNILPGEKFLNNTIITEKDLDTYFNSLTSDNLLKFKKEIHNQIERTKYGYLLCKDANGNIIPTNTIQLFLKEDDFTVCNDKVIIPPNQTYGLNITADEAFLVKDGQKYDFEYSSPLMTVINKNMLSVSYYLTMIDDDYIMKYNYINQNSFLQFIANSINICKSFLENDDKYIITLNISQNTNVDKKLIQLDENENIVSSKIYPVLILKSGNGEYYVKGTVINFKKSTYVYSIKFEIESDNLLDDENNIRLNNLLLSGKSENNGKCNVYFPQSIDMSLAIYIDLEEGNYGSNTTVPEYADYTLCNIYDIQSVNLIYNFTSIMRTGIKVVLDNDSNTSYRLTEVPLIKKSYMDDYDRCKYFIDFLQYRKNYIDLALNTIEQAFEIDMKYYNTYGPSKVYRIGHNGESLDKVNIILRFIVGLIAGVDKSIFESIKKFIQQKIEDFNTSDDTFIHMGNICKAVMDEYTNYVDYIEFVNLNDYDAKYTYLDKNQVCVDKIHQVPELLNINRTDNINSDIILLDPSSTL